MDSVINRLRKDINKEKKKLIEREKKCGIYENFGQKEVRILRGRYSCIPYPNRAVVLEKINEFSNWCATYTGGR